MGLESCTFTITDIWWERIFLNIEIEAEKEMTPRFFLRSEAGTEIPLDAAAAGGRHVITINIACVSDRSFLENGRWYIAAGNDAKDSSRVRCTVKPEVAYRLDDLSRIFKYAENQMAYNISFSVRSEDDRSLLFYMDSYFMAENRHWKRRRYVREVRGLREKTKRFFMFAAIVLIRAYYHVAYAVMPKRGDRVMIMSETKDRLWGNLKAIDDRIKARGLDRKFRITYSYRNAAGKHQSFKDIASWIRTVTKVAAQDVIFVDDYAPVLGFFNLGKKTKLVQVWHAGEGFKSVGYSRFGKDGSPFPQGSCHKKYTHVITGSEHLIDVFHEVFAIEKDAFYPFGMPRLDGFLDSDRIERFRADFFKKYPELEGKKIILFAPTYRGSEQKEAFYDQKKIDLARIDAFCHEKGYAFLIKMHPFVKEKWDISDSCGGEIYDLSDFPDINKLYYITDVLITDYSSNYFEYALLGRPVIFYTYDREVYELTRGVHRSIRDSAPGKVCDDFDQLMDCLEKEDFEIDKIRKFAEENFAGYDGNAADRVIDEILLGKGSTE